MKLTVSRDGLTVIVIMPAGPGAVVFDWGERAGVGSEGLDDSPIETDLAEEVDVIDAITLVSAVGADGATKSFTLRDWFDWAEAGKRTLREHGRLEEPDAVTEGDPNWVDFADALREFIEAYPRANPDEPYPGTGLWEDPWFNRPDAPDRGQHTFAKNMLREAIGRALAGNIEAGTFDRTRVGMPNLSGDATAVGALFPLDPQLAEPCRRLGFQRLATAAVAGLAGVNMQTIMRLYEQSERATREGPVPAPREPHVYTEFVNAHRLGEFDAYADLPPLIPWGQMPDRPPEIRAPRGQT